MQNQLTAEAEKKKREDETLISGEMEALLRHFNKRETI